ncbi:hypothetical protein RV15_GL002374 [Enterococcus silesiacus]|uniref:Uncharacterized protein n=1 Tax=Enterococcus silesiacus TaxID=332949 RepID=A0AA91JMS7_9ENTE|nr:hypothetical protein [Enterococcus silesiacus]OJG86515.1 hypothetical protein RV15_GL002374 [Enterococcus silesiacus]
MNKEIEQRIAELREKYKALPPEKKAEWEHHIKKRNFLNYKKIELIKSELLRLEARRAQLELCDREKELGLIEKKITCKKEKLLRYLGKQLNQ